MVRGRFSTTPSAKCRRGAPGGSGACPRALAPMLRLQFGLTFVRPNGLAAFGRLFHRELPSGCDRATLPSFTDIRKVKSRVGGADIGFGEAQSGAHYARSRPSLKAHSKHPGRAHVRRGSASALSTSSPLAFTTCEPRSFRYRPPSRSLFALHADQILPNFGYDKSKIAALREEKVI